MLTVHTGDLNLDPTVSPYTIKKSANCFTPSPPTLAYNIYVASNTMRSVAKQSKHLQLGVTFSPLWTTRGASWSPKAAVQLGESHTSRAVQPAVPREQYGILLGRTISASNCKPLGCNPLFTILLSLSLTGLNQGKLPRSVRAQQ